MTRKVLFATPTYDYTFSVDYVASMMATSIHLTHLDIDCRAKYVGGLCFIDLARNELVNHFLSTDCTDLFFIDADVGWDYHVIPRMLEHKEFIVAGMVPKKWDHRNKEKPPFHDNAMTGKMENGLMESYEAPTAFMRIKREVFEILDAAYPHYGQMNTLERGKAYFQTGFVEQDGKTTFMGEDIFFCRQWCKLGEKLWIDPDIDFTHRGSNTWHGNHMKWGLEQGKYVPIETSSAA